MNTRILANSQLPEQYALIEASFMIARLLQTYDAVEWHGSTGRLAKGFTLTMYPKDGVPVRLRRAQKS